MKLHENPFDAQDYSQVLKTGLKYIEERMVGRVKSFRTPWTGLNRAGIGGLEWGSIMTIGARPGSGKTMVVSQLLKESRLHNPDQDFSILEFQFEMGDKQYAARQFAAEVAMDYNEVLSSDKQLDEFTYKQMQRYLADTLALEKMGVQRKLIKKPLPPQKIEEAIRYYFEKMNGKPMIVTIDHSWLIKKGPAEKDKFDTLYNTAEMLMQVKNDLPVIVLMITQMNRTMEETARLNPGIIGNYPTSSDIFGGDALMQASDMVVALNRPFKQNVNIYGPKKYITDKSQIYMHLLKTRNSSDDANLLFMQGEFNRQRMIEIPEPARHTQTASGYTPRNNWASAPSATVGDDL